MDIEDINMLVAILSVVALALSAVGYVIYDNRDSKIIIDRREQDGWQ